MTRTPNKSLFISAVTVLKLALLPPILAGDIVHGREALPAVDATDYLE